jgi:SAM-dependent methyltransferase
MTPPLHPNHRFMLSWAEREGPGARILDFGCGSGEVVAAGLAAGRDIFGVEIFAGESSARADAERQGLLGHRIVEVREGRLPFDDGMFALAVSNTVFEHVEDLGSALAEIHRVLRPGGRLVAFFPSQEVLRENHFGVPFLHWLRRGSRLRLEWATLWRRLGGGRHTEGRGAREWARHAIDWIDRYTIYRRRPEILRAFGRRFRTSQGEVEFLRFRLLLHGRLRPLAPLLRIPWVIPAAREGCRRWGGLVIVARKES